MKRIAISQVPVMGVVAAMAIAVVAVVAVATRIAARESHASSTESTQTRDAGEHSVRSVEAQARPDETAQFTGTQDPDQASEEMLHAKREILRAQLEAALPNLSRLRVEYLSVIVLRDLKSTWRAVEVYPDAAGTHDEVKATIRLTRGDVTFGSNVHLKSSPGPAAATALQYTWTQKRLPPQPGLPEGTFTGLPIGEWARYSAPDPAPGTPPVRQMGSGLTVYDSTVALTSTVHYPIDASDGSPGSERITDEDLLMAEYQARLILSAALLVANDFDSMPRGEMTVGGSRVPTRRTPDGVTLVPLARWAEAVGATVASGAPGRGVFPGGFVPVLPNSGVWSVTRGDRTVIVPLAARAIIVETVRVDLPFPVVKSGDEVWVAVEAIEEALLL